MSATVTFHNVDHVRIGKPRPCLESFVQEIEILSTKGDRLHITLFADSEESLADPDLSAFEEEDVRSIIRKEAA